VSEQDGCQRSAVGLQSIHPRDPSSFQFRRIAGKETLL